MMLSASLFALATPSPYSAPPLVYRFHFILNNASNAFFHTLFIIEFWWLYFNLSVFQTCELEGHEAQVTSVIVVPASTPASRVLCYCWTASLDGKIKYWDFAAPELMKTIDIRFPIHYMVFYFFIFMIWTEWFRLLYYACYCPLVNGYEEMTIV